MNDIANSDAIVKALRAFLVPGQVTELRALDATVGSDRYVQTYSGYFDEPQKLAAAAGTIKSAKGIYFIPNPVNPSLLARAANRIRAAKKEPLTSDRDIDARRWLLVDLDAERPAGISATDEEHAAALAKAEEIRDALVAEDWPLPVEADSGNGAHLLYRIDLPVDDGGLIGRCLAALDFRFSGAGVQVDTTTFNPSRIWKLYGTKAAKGDNTPDRPHRLSGILAVPDKLDIVPRELLERLAACAPQPPEAPHRQNGHGGDFDLERWIAEHLPEAEGPWDWQGGRKWILPVCPWNETHTNRSAYIVQLASGAIGAGCHHNGCSGLKWADLREMVEPSYRERRTEANGNGKVAIKGQPPAEEWPEPRALPGELVPVMPFEFDLLPEEVRPWIEDIAERVQCPPDFPAVGVIVALSIALGRKIAIRPKRRDDWTVVANLWGCVVGRPGIMKTPALQEPLRPLKRLEIEAKKRFEAEKVAYERAMLLYEAQKKAAEKKLHAAVKAGDAAEGLLDEILAEQPVAPVRRRYLLQDATVEKLGEILAVNPQGVGLYRDEFIAFLRTLDKEGREADRGFCLEAWNGTGRFTYDRIGRGTIDIEAACLSMIGGIQPGPLYGYMAAAAERGSGDDGLMQRLQLLVYPDVSPEWRNVDEFPNTAAKQAAYAVFQRLDALDAVAVGAKQEEDDEIPYLRFDHRAQERFDAWREELEWRLRSGDLAPAMESHLAKYRSLVPSMALICHLVDVGHGSVWLASLEKAIRWGEYLESHARRVYGARVDHDLSAARALARKIRQGKLRDEFALRDVYRNHWAELDEKESAEAAVKILAEYGWLKVEKRKTSGAPATVYRINPRIEALPSGTSGTFVTVCREAPGNNGRQSPDADLEAINRRLAEAAEDDGDFSDANPEGVTKAPKAVPAGEDDDWGEL